MARLLLLSMVLSSTGWAQDVDAEAEAETTDGATNDGTDQSARRVYLEGRTAFDEGRYEDALRLFEAAYGLSARPELLYNIGTAADRLRQNDRALEAFEQYLDEVPESDLRSAVESRVRVLRGEISQREAEEEHQRRLEEALRRAEEPKSKWWVGVLVGGLALVVTAITLGFVLRDDTPNYESGDGGRLVFTLQRTP